LVHWKVCLEPNIFFYTTLYNDCWTNFFFFNFTFIEELLW
jgi:hypothetical protein